MVEHCPLEFREHKVTKEASKAWQQLSRENNLMGSESPLLSLHSESNYCAGSFNDAKDCGTYQGKVQHIWQWRRGGKDQVETGRLTHEGMASTRQKTEPHRGVTPLAI